MRAYLSETILDPRGNAVAGASVRVEDPATGDLLADTLYAVDGSVLANPLTTDSAGGVVCYLDRPQRVQLRASKDGVTGAALGRDCLAPLDTWLDVRSYGAKGDGSADDTAAIQRAIDKASVSGGLVYLPPAVYLVNTPPLYLKSGVTLLGDGKASLLKLRGTASNHLLRALDGQADIRISNLALDGNGAAQTGNRNAVEIDNTSRVHVDHIWIANTCGDGLQFQGACSDVVIDSIIGQNIGRNCIAIAGAAGLPQRVSISNVVGTATKAYVIQPNACVDVEAGRDVTISNVVSNLFHYGLVLKSTASNNPAYIAQNITCGNIVALDPDGVGVFLDGRNGQLRDVIVSGVRVAFTQSIPTCYCGIRVEEDVCGWGVSEFLVGSAANSFGPTGDGVGITFTTVAPSGGVLANGTTYNASAAGVTCSASNTVLSGVRVCNSGGVGIHLTQAPIGVVVAHCRAWDDRTPKQQTYGLVAEAGADYITDIGNDFRGNLTGERNYVDATHRTIIAGAGSAPVVTGSKASGAALTSLLTQLASIGLIADSTTA